MTTKKMKVNPLKTKVTRQRKYQIEDDKKRYVEIKHGENSFRPMIRGKLAVLYDTDKGYDLFNGTSHYRGRTTEDLFADVLNLMETYYSLGLRNTFIVQYDAYHHLDKVSSVILKSDFFKPNQPKMEQEVVLKGYTKEGERKRKSLTVVSTFNYIGVDEEQLDGDNIEEVTENIYSFISEMRNEFEDCFAETIARTGWNKWVRDFLLMDIVMPRWVNTKFLPALRGGRVQAYALGKFKELYQYDARSLYGYIMDNRLYSVKPILSWYNLPRNVEFLSDLIRKGQKKRGSINGDPREILKSLPEAYYRKALEIFKTNSSFKETLEELFWPNAQTNYFIFATWEYPKGSKRVSLQSKNAKGYLTEHLRGSALITGIEFLRAYEEGAKLEVHSVTAFKSEDIFNGFGQHLFQRKEKTQGVERTFYKLMMVATPSKSAQKRRNNRVARKDEKLIAEGGYQVMTEEWAKGDWQINPRLKLKNGAVATLHKFGVEITRETNLRVLLPMIDTEVTAYARDYMFGIMQEIAKEYGWKHILYTNTDSIVTDIPVDEILRRIHKFGYKMGDFRLEYQGAGELFGLNDYYIDDKEKGTHYILGGIPRTAVLQGDIITWSTRPTPRSDQRSFVIDLVEMRKRKDKSKLKYVESEYGNRYGFPLGNLKYPVIRLGQNLISNTKRLEILLISKMRKMTVSHLSTEREIAKQTMIKNK